MSDVTEKTFNITKEQHDELMYTGKMLQVF